MRVRFGVLFALSALVVAGVATLAAPASAGVSTDWKQLGAGRAHACGVTTAGRLFCWGSDGSGAVGDGDDDEATEHRPVEVAGARTDWKQVSAGFAHTCATTTSKQLFCWGADNQGEIGDGDDGGANQLEPVLVPGKWKRVSAGERFTCGLRTNGKLFCWGFNIDGQLGDGGGNGGEEESPLPVAGNLKSWTEIDTGKDHACAQKKSGKLFCWGDNDQGQLGTGGPDDDALTPQAVSGGIRSWTRLSLGSNHSCALRKNGKLFCWGSDAAGAIGNGFGAETEFNMPVQVAGGLIRYKSVAAGAFLTCATTTDRQAYCWGFDEDGELGDGDDDELPEHAPVIVSGAATDWKALSGGERVTCGLKTSGRAFCWGRDASGEVGDGDDDEADEHVPVDVQSHP